MKLLAFGIQSDPQVFYQSLIKLKTSSINKLVLLIVAMTACYQNVLIGQTITTSSVFGPFCAGSKVNVPYLYSGPALTTGNQFVAELSDASGGFSSPITIGTFSTTTLTNWTVSATIPSTIVQGTGYRVRVRSTAPAAIGSASPIDITLYEMYTGSQVFVESCGTTVSASVAIHESNNRFDNDGFLMSATGGVSISNSGGSNGYTGASGSNNVRFNGTAGTFIISDINTTAYTQLGLGFGISKGNASIDGSEITVAVSSDGTNYTNLSFTPLPTGGGTNGTWYYRVSSGSIPATSNLRIRFTLASSNTVTYQIDDIELGNAVSPATVAISPNTPQSMCNPGTMVLTATNVANANYSWSTAETTSSITVNSTGNYSVTASDLFGCAVTRGPVSVTEASSFTPSVSISNNSGSIVCSGSPISFTASPIAGGTSPSYQWKLNGSNIGTNSSTFTTSSLVNGDVVSCVMTSNLACVSTTTATSNSMAITVNPRPTATISGTQNLCNGSVATLSVAVTGTGPWSGTLSNGTAFSGSTSPISVSVSPSSNTTYTVASLSDSKCTAVAGDLSGSAIVTVLARPTGTLSGSQTICNGATATLSIAVTGAGPWSGTLSSGHSFSGSSSPISVAVTPNSNTNFTIATLVDAVCTANSGDKTGSADVIVNARPTGVISGTQTICNGESANLSIAVTGVGPWSGTLSNGSSFSGSSGPISVSVTPGTATSFTIATLADANCTANSSDKTGIALVSLNQRPTGILGGNQTICVGATATLYVSATGSGNYSGTLNPGAIPFSGSGSFITVDVTPASNTTYTLATLTDDNCTSQPIDLSGSPTVVVHSMPTATISGTASICEGSSSTIVINGTPDSEVIYTINGGANLSTMLDASGVANLNTGPVATSLIYDLVSINDFVCQNAVSGSSTISKLDLPEASISGSTSVCFGSPATLLISGTPGAVVTVDANSIISNETIGVTGQVNFTLPSVAANTSVALVSVSNGTCSQTLGVSATVTVYSNTYFQDNDGDGYGNPLASLLACTAPLGYVTNSNDCCDTNADVNPNTEWWADIDGDGYGSFVMESGCLAGVSCASSTWPANRIPYNPAAHGGAIYTPDCNDNQASVNVTATEVCGNNIDDNCNGSVDEGCNTVANDNWVNAIPFNVNIAAAMHPNCFYYNSNMMNASVSAQGNPANVAVGGGRDVWYKFVAPSTAIQIKLVPNGFDGVIELQNSSAVQIDVENINNNIGGMEVLNIGTLTVGQTYYVGVRNYNTTNVGTFSICASPLMPSGCALNTPVGGFTLCSNYKAISRAASSYTFNFTGTGGSAPLVTTSSTGTGLIPLNSPSLDLRYGGVYNVRVDANYTVYNGLNIMEPTITVLGNTSSPNCSGVSIAAQPNVEVRANQRCPVVLNRNIYLNATPVSGDPMLCGALSYTYEFTKVTDCSGLITLPTTFTVTTANSSPYLILAAAFPGAQANVGYWNVRIRPNFVWGAGSYGPTRTIQVTGTSASQMLQENQGEEALRVEDAAILSTIYPNPNNGDALNINLYNTGNGEVKIKIYDGVGQLVYSNQYAAEGSLNKEIRFENALTSGIYFVEISTNDQTFTERMIVGK